MTRSMTGLSGRGLSESIFQHHYRERAAAREVNDHVSEQNDELLAGRTGAKDLLDQLILTVGNTTYCI